MTADPLFPEMYLPDARDRAIFGGVYAPPPRFVHGEWHQVALLKKDPIDGDGYDVAIDECRMPARFFRLRVLPSENSRGDLRTPRVSISTGSGDGVGRLILEIARALTEGMVGFDTVAAEEAAP